MPRRRPDGAAVPLLVTADLELALDHDLDQQRRILEVLERDLERLHLPVTFFVTAEAAERFAGIVTRLGDAGHEIACHGLAHGPDEDYARMPLRRLQGALQEATRRIAGATGRTPRCFRGPGMTTSTPTQRALVELGYDADFSVCSQRLDIVNSRGGRLGWLTAPRAPYRPSEASPFRRGALPIRVMPLSCAGAPFLSGMLYLTGSLMQRRLFAILLREARRTGQPIVYAFHTYEFCDVRPAPPGAARPKRLHRLYRRDRAWRYAAHLELFEHMLAQPDIAAMTASRYLDRSGRAAPAAAGTVSDAARLLEVAP